MKSIANLILSTILLCCISLTTTTAQIYGEHIRLENRWKSNVRIHIEHGKLEATPVKDGAWSAMWIINRSTDGQYVTIQNRWKQKLYLVASQQGPVEYAVNGTESYAQWRLEKASDGNYFKITSRHFPNKFLHIEHGTLQLSQGKPGWHSAQWTIETIGKSNKTTPPTTVSTKPTPSSQKNKYDVRVSNIKCLGVDSGESGSANEFYGEVSIATSDRNFLPSVVWHKSESNPQDVTAGRSIPINSSNYSVEFSNQAGNNYILIKGTIKEDDDFGGDDNLGTRSKKVYIKDIKEGVNRYKVTGFRDDGDVAEINFEITKTSPRKIFRKKKRSTVSNHNTPVHTLYLRYTDQISGTGGFDVKVGSKVYVLPNQTVKNSPGISFDPQNPKICGKTFTVASVNPLKFSEPFPENMRNTNNSSFAFKVQKIR